MMYKDGVKPIVIGIDLAKKRGTCKPLSEMDKIHGNNRLYPLKMCGFSKEIRLTREGMCTIIYQREL